MRTLSTTPLLNNPRVDPSLLDFGYVEFTNADDATKAANCSEHLIKGKRASVQFFKTKDNHQQQKKVAVAFESNERATNPIPVLPTFNSGIGQFPYSLQGRYQQSSDFNLFGPRNGCPSYLYQPFFSTKEALADTNYYKNPFIVQAKESRPAGQQRKWADFYNSLKRADLARHCSLTYSAENLRFKKLKPHN